MTLQDVSDRLADALGVPRAQGVIVSAVDPSGPADQAGLRPADVLETVDNVQQSDSRAFMRSIVRLPVGTKVHLTGWRDGQKLDITVTVAAWPNYMPAQGVMRAQAAQSMIEKAPDPGMRLAAITAQARKQYGLGPTQSRRRWCRRSSRIARRTTSASCPAMSSSTCRGSRSPRRTM